MPRCPWCKELMDREVFGKHVEAHIQVFRESHPEVPTPDECEPLKPNETNSN